MFESCRAHSEPHWVRVGQVGRTSRPDGLDNPPRPMERGTRDSGWWLLAWVVGGAFVCAVVLAIALGVIVAASGGDGYDIGYAAGLALVPGFVLGAILGGLVYFIRYVLGR